jgi:hypothetical protein
MLLPLRFEGRERVGARALSRLLRCTQVSAAVALWCPVEIFTWLTLCCC